MLERLIDYSPYVGILAALCLGSLGAPIPEEIPVVTAGLLARQEVVRWWLALPLCVVGVLSADRVHELLANVYRIDRWIAVLAVVAAAGWIGVFVWRRSRRMLG